MNLLGRVALSTLRGYSRIALTERGGFRLARMARSLVPESQRQGTFQTPDGLRLNLDLRTYPDINMAVGLYELDTARLIHRLLKPGSWFVDVGANLGYFTLLAAKWTAPTGRVDAFEPDPLNRQRLEQHLHENDLGDRVRIYPIAASSQMGEVQLIHPQAAGTNHGMASFYKSLAGEGQTFTVPTARLDQILDGSPDLIKLDVEGAELVAIEGMEKILHSSTPPKLIIEHNPTSCAAAGYRPGDIFLKLLQFQPRYKIFWIGWRLKQINSSDHLNSISRQGNILVTTNT
ncbi:MAG TPA: FkbM family methyltransferase [Tepidisphaeraceae bacterium]|nr:FkbM family methyltransferase [Tepidisphaeraceae bacterium]